MTQETPINSPQPPTQDPIINLILFPIMPLILGVQLINTAIANLTNIPRNINTPSNAYKNDETWTISEDKNGKVIIKVERLAQRK